MSSKQAAASDVDNYLVRGATFHDDVALVQFEAHDTVDGALAGRNGAHNKFTLGREPVPVVKNSAELNGDELVAEGTDVPVERQTFNIHMCDPEDRSGGRLVAPTRLDADEPVLDNVNTADAVFAGECVEREEDVHCVGVCLILFRHYHLHGKTGLELDRDALGRIGRVFGSGRQFPHVCGGRSIGIFEDTGFIRDMEQVLVG